MKIYATSSDIVADVYFVLRTFFAGKVSGKVYRSDSRPLDSKTEDVVIGFSNGDADQIQEGDLHVNVFIPDIDNNSGTRVPDYGRIDTISGYGDDMIDELNNMYIDDYLFELGKATDSFAEKETNEHFVAFYVHFKRKTF